MAKKFLIAIAALIVLAFAGLLVLRIWGSDLAWIAFVPSEQFKALVPLADDAYASDQMWITRPGVKPAYAPLRPAGSAPAPAAPANAAIFFIHPTSYFNRAHWTAPLSDAEANKRAALFTRIQASVFQDAGAIWAPRYRQATLGAFLDASTNAAQAKDAAYRDVELAFAAFVAALKPGQPVILAGHSQGTLHLLRLLNEQVKGKPIVRQLVAAYVIGWPVSLREDVPALGMPPCVAPEQTGCLISWQSFAEPAQTTDIEAAFDEANGLSGRPNRGSDMLCSNPLAGGSPAAALAEANLGTLKMAADALDNPAAAGELVKGAVPARCAGRGFLLIGDPPAIGNLVNPGNNYHAYDYNLFWANLRGDVLARLAAFEQVQ